MHVQLLERTIMESMVRNRYSVMTVFKGMDKNHDNKLTRSEFEKVSHFVDLSNARSVNHESYISVGIIFIQALATRDLKSYLATHCCRNSMESYGIWQPHIISKTRKSHFHVSEHLLNSFVCSFFF